MEANNPKVGDYVVREATVEDADLLIGRLRQSDHDEVRAAMGISADEGLVLSLRLSTMAWIGLNAGRAVVAFGVSPRSLYRQEGIPWLLGTDEIDRVGMGVLRKSRHFTQKMLDRYGYLENYTDDRHKSAHDWLRWCGFTIEEPERYGVARLPFRRFWMKKGN